MEILKVGPLGDYKRGNHWEETGLDPISHIFVTFDKETVTSIQCGYVKDRALVLSKKYGSKTGTRTRIVRLNHVSEFVTGIRGEVYCGCIYSLTFHTNERKHEAFHAELERRPERREFHSGIHDRREWGGFFGTCSSSLIKSIGLYLRPVLSGGRTI